MTLPTHPSTGEAQEIVVWRFVDGKPGHENQSRGLLAALARRLPLRIHEVRPLPARRAIWNWARAVYAQTDALPAPDLIVGAGHATHWSMLAAKRARGGRTVVLMRPSLPLAWFDLCIIPAHDRPPARPNVLLTQGVINAVQRSSGKDPNAGLMLIGGPSRHYEWDEASVFEQARAVLAASEFDWVIATSRRTPPSTESALRSLAGTRVRLVPGRDTDRDWLPAQLGRAAVIWISADSVSMIYEALTSGGACGLLELPPKAQGRVPAGVDALVEQGTIVTYRQWRSGTPLVAPARPLDEAGRCAQWIEQEWLIAS